MLKIGFINQHTTMHAAQMNFSFQGMLYNYTFIEESLGILVMVQNVINLTLW